MREHSLPEWRTLCPNLSIGDQPASQPHEFNSMALAKTADRFWQEGYLQLETVFDQKEIEAISGGMETLRHAGIPPVYIYLYDQPWLLFERLRPLIAYFLGADYAVLPNLWAWDLWKTGDTGWPPHRDCDAETVFQVGGDQLLMSLSLWIPLTDTAEENGCMHVIPRHKETSLPQDGKLEVSRLQSFAKALPARAGTVLGWPQDLVHWGGEMTEQAAGPRMSLSFEFQNRVFEPLAEPLLDTAALPPFDQRLQLIEQQFNKYRHIAAPQ